MKKQPQGYGPHFDVEDAFGSIIDNAARATFWLGLVATIAGVAFLLVTYHAFSQATPPASIDQARSNVEILSKVLLAGVMGLVVGTTYMFWGEEVLGALQLLGSCLLWFTPYYVPGMLGGSMVTPASSAALAAIQLGGTVAAGLSVVVLIADIISRVKLRSKIGTKADQLKYGKGVKEEPAVRNVFMGKCWQLPFCRKFVREKCPIYHARRTCWRERVGCMCEEEVIRGAMDNRAIPKDMVAAAKYIPVNNKLSDRAKIERCKQCVIYNEHQRQKYKAALPITMLAMGGIWVMAREPMKNLLGEVLSGADKFLGQATLAGKKGVTDPEHLAIFRELLVILLMIMILAYLMKLIEYLLFKLKV